MGRVKDRRRRSRRIGAGMGEFVGVWLGDSVGTEVWGSGIKSSMDIGTRNTFVSIICDDPVCKGIAFVFTDAGPVAKFFQRFEGMVIGDSVVDGLPKMKIKESRDVRALTSCSFDRCAPTKTFYSHMVEKLDNIEDAKEPKSGRCASAVHDEMSEATNFLNTSFSIVLMLMVRFTLVIADMVHAQDIFDTTTNLDFGIIAEE